MLISDKITELKSAKFSLYIHEAYIMHYAYMMLPVGK